MEQSKGFKSENKSKEDGFRVIAFIASMFVFLKKKNFFGFKLNTKQKRKQHVQKKKQKQKKVAQMLKKMATRHFINLLKKAKAYNKIVTFKVGLSKAYNPIYRL